MKYLLLLLFTTSAFAEVDCLRFMGTNANLTWKKECSEILSDVGQIEVKSIEGCLGKYTKKGIKYLVFNSNIINEDGFVKTDSIIVSGSKDKFYSENEKEIMLSKHSASPELFQRYQHDLKFDKFSEELHIKKEEGLFRLNNKYDITLKCK